MPDPPLPWWWGWPLFEAADPLLDACDPSLLDAGGAVADVVFGDGDAGGSPDPDVV